MEVIAKQQGDTYLLSASKQEIEAILNATTGNCPKEILLGTRLPGIDYAGSIMKLKGLADSSHMRNLVGYVNDFNERFDLLKKAIEDCKSIES